MSSSNLTGFVLAVLSSAFIGSSFIIKKKGLQLASANGPRASVGGYGYLLQPLWWVGMITMIVGEIANFVAYIYAPAVLVTPLGALSIIVSAVLAHFLLKEKLQKMGMLGCLLCIVGSTVIVLHAPEEKSLSSVQEIWELAIQPAFLSYTASAIAVTLFLVLYCAPRHGQTNILVYTGICSIVGSLTVMSVKAVGIAIKLTLEGANQAFHFQAWVFAMVSVTCIIVQLNYLNMALDNFNTAVVSPIYYALFTSFTILASAIMFKDYSGQSISSIASELCGFITILSGTTILHSTREPDPPVVAGNTSCTLVWRTWMIEAHHYSNLIFIYTIVSESVVVYPRQQRTLETGGGCVTLEFNCDYTARPFQVTKEAKLHEAERRQCFLFWGEI
ncbi:putative magnesium transporter NIPA7 [Glycine soja]